MGGGIFYNVTNRAFLFLFSVQTWKMQYGKSYHNSEATAGLGEISEEESFRMKIWMENKAYIQNHNRQFYKVKQAA